MKSQNKELRQLLGIKDEMEIAAKLKQYIKKKNYTSKKAVNKSESQNSIIESISPIPRKRNCTPLEIKQPPIQTSEQASVSL